MPGYEIIGKEELREIKDIFDNGGVLFRHGFDHLRNGIYKVNQFEKKFSKKMNTPYALAVTSGTAALRVALAAIEIKPKDEIITQSFTFVATVEAIIESRGIPIITEIDDTLNMDPKDFEKKITKNTKAVIVVHMLGTPARLDEIKKIAKKHKIFLIEDTAWGCGGKYNGIPLGNFGDIGTFSFDFAKTMTTGEGGMVIFKNKKLFNKAAAWHDHGHENNPKLPRWEDSRSSSGFNYRMNELQGAVGIAQLKKLDKVVKGQRKSAKKILSILKKYPLTLRKSPKGSKETFDSLVFFVSNPKLAIRCRNQLLSRGIGTKILPEALTWHFAGSWSHMPQLLKKYGKNIRKKFPKSYSYLNKAVSIPISMNYKNKLAKKINTALEKTFKKKI